MSKNAPVIVKSLSEIKLHQDKTKEVDLSEYFEDKEGSAITYGVDTDSDEVKAEIEGSVLRLRQKNRWKENCIFTQITER